MFALFEAGLQSTSANDTPRLRRFAPYLGLTLYNLYEVVCRTNPITGQVVNSRCKTINCLAVISREQPMQNFGCGEVVKSRCKKSP